MVISVVLGVFITRGIMRALGDEPADAANAAQRVAEGDLEASTTLAPNDRKSLMASLESDERHDMPMRGKGLRPFAG
ncbi:hypothetical protein Bphyt_6334 [Paraburkholderia phytofirmans PsJN]|uniref:Uncharacterized protein n=1 Tax=Paraburkholderia phytofirmans (strain DSM 17436 / LMG 22146 / PsJN) TaxID=398527 RepID=B2TB68_PARPJ|nr:hypothetical protein Bphyt_6334 [Paraburkholderia phytofirmans PsJN]